MIDWLRDNWMWLGAAATAFLCLRYAYWSREERIVRFWWARLPVERKVEILYVRERIHASGEPPPVRPDQVDEHFENALVNARGADGRWAFRLLQEQVFMHTEACGYRNLRRLTRPAEAR